MWVNAHQMLINGKAEDITIEDVLEVAKRADIKSSEAFECITQVKSALLKWEEFGDEAGLSNRNIERIKTFFNTNLFCN